MANNDFHMDHNLGPADAAAIQQGVCPSCGEDLDFGTDVQRGIQYIDCPDTEGCGFELRRPVNS